jgi:soluble lytic murein transglycosylase-like protein
MVSALPIAVTPPQFYRGMGAYTPAQTQVQALIVQAAQTQGVPPNIALAVAAHESQFIPTAKNSTSSAAGVFQLISSAQQYTGVTNPYDPNQNVNAGVSLLAMYYKQYGNWPQAIQAFSEGPGTVASGQPPSGQTQNLIDYINTFDPSQILSAVGVDASGAPSTIADAAASIPDQVTTLVAGIDFTDPTTIVLGLGLLAGLVWIAREL